MTGQCSGGRPALAYLLVALAVVLVAPWQLADPDSLSRLAIGRAIVAAGEVPLHDPFTFSAPELPWSNPEWLGDVIWYGVFRLAGQPGVQLFKLLVLCSGWLLVLHLARRQGAAPLLSSALILLVLLGSTSRFTARNHIYAYSLVALYGLLSRGPLSWRRAAILLGLGALWANLHGSFVLGWVVLAAALLQRLAPAEPGAPHDGQAAALALATASGSPRRDAQLLAGVLLLHPSLALISPTGWHNYRQLWDHLSGADIYRALILEWQPPEQAAAALAAFPLHVLALVGLCSFLPRKNRRQVGAFLMLGAGLALAYSSQRFLPLLGVLAIPGVAANLSRLLASVSQRARRLVAPAALSLSAALLLPVVITVRTEAHDHVLHGASAPLKPARWLASHAPSGSRLFSPYNAGPWLLWAGAGQPSIYIDPRNNLGAAQLERYLALLEDPAAFAREARAHRIGLVLVDLSEGRMARLTGTLQRSASWQLVYFDGRYGVFARRSAANERLIDRHGYALVQARLDLEYLLRPPDPPPLLAAADRFSLAHDLHRLGQQGPAMQAAVQGYRLLCRQGRPPPRLEQSDEQANRAAHQLLKQALPGLPPSPALMTYLATAEARLQNRAAAAELLDLARTLFPADPLPAAAAELILVKPGQQGRSAPLSLPATIAQDSLLARALAGEALVTP